MQRIAQRRPRNTVADKVATSTNAPVAASLMHGGFRRKGACFLRFAGSSGSESEDKAAVDEREEEQEEEE